MSAALLARARAAAAQAYAPYSHFHVGAAVETATGEIFASANLENASYGLTLCAEAGALQAANAAGLWRAVRRIAIAGGPAAGGGGVVFPCGRCRQLVAEAAQAARYDIEVHCANADLSETFTAPISALLPQAFGPGDFSPPP
ncbi:MAG: cytidine deaminase [Hyphomonadaceae bacterium]